VVNHCTAPAVTLRSRMSRGIATRHECLVENYNECSDQEEVDDESVRPTVSATFWADDSVLR